MGLQLAPIGRAAMSDFQPVICRIVIGSTYSILILADRTTLAHFSVSSPMSLPNCADVIDSGRTPKLTRRPRVSGSPTIALISLLSLSMIAVGEAAGAQMPNQPLGS